MGWRDVLDSAIAGGVDSPWRDSDCRAVSAALLTMPAPDRIALARELLAGTEYDATVRALVEALEAAVECGIVPKSSAAEGGAMRFSQQVQVADQIRAALARAKAEGL